MQNNDNPQSLQDEITLAELFKILFSGKWTIIFYTAIASVFIVFFSLSLPNVYRSEALLTPVASENSLSGALENLGSLGALGFWSMMLFLAILTIGFIYEWKKGALEWE